VPSHFSSCYRDQMISRTGAEAVPPMKDKHPRILSVSSFLELLLDGSAQGKQLGPDVRAGRYYEADWHEKSPSWAVRRSAPYTNS
jgi:hypothetical protein